MLYLSTGYRGFESLLLRSKAPRLQEQRGVEEEGRVHPGPYYTNVARIPSFAATNTAFVTVYLYSRLPYLVVAPSMQRGPDQTKSVSLSTPMQDAGYRLRRISLPRTPVNKGER